MVRVTGWQRQLETGGKLAALFGPHDGLPDAPRVPSLTRSERNWRERHLLPKARYERWLQSLQERSTTR